VALTSLGMTGKRRVQDKIFCLGYHTRDANNANLLFELARTDWENMNNEVYLQSLIESMPQRLQKVIDAEGGWARYLKKKKQKTADFLYFDRFCILQK
jgi:hypothetical protein